MPIEYGKSKTGQAAWVLDYSHDHGSEHEHDQLAHELLGRLACRRHDFPSLCLDFWHFICSVVAIY